MAVHCPRCQNPIEQEFGVAACTKCHALLFIDMDGNAQVTEEAGDEAADSQAAEPQVTEIQAAESTREPSIHQTQEVDGMLSASHSLVNISALPDEENDTQVLGAKPIEVPDENEPMQSLVKVEADLDELLEKDAKVPVPTDEADLTGVYVSPEQALGGLSYSVKIEKIDTKELRLQMIEALDDPKFQWDPREVMQTLKAGAVEIRNLNPVKASVVIQRVRDLPVKITWKQHVYN